MAQFGIHAIAALWLCSLVPFFLPFIKRRSFIYGLYWGCVFPDLDVFPTAVALMLGAPFALDLHRTYLHSLITACCLCSILHILELVSRRKVESQAGQKESLIQGKQLNRINFSALSCGLLFGICVHILLDIILWFSAVHILWPISEFRSLKIQPVNMWTEIKVSDLFGSCLSVAEIFTIGIFFSLLRWYTNKKLRLFQISRATPEIPNTDSSDTSIVKPIEKEVFYFGGLKYKPVHLLWVEILHYTYTALLLIAMWVVSPTTLFYLVFIVLLGVSVPTFYFFSWKLRELLLWCEPPRL